MIIKMSSALSFISLFNLLKSDRVFIDLKNNDSFPSSVNAWQTINEPNSLTILSTYVYKSSSGKWFIPARYQKYSAGWNRTVAKGYLDQPIACDIEIYGLALESTLSGYVDGGTGYLQFHYQLENGKKIYVGMETNETKKIHCYYMTSRNFGSEFIDSPKTLGLAITCPISMDMEIGEFLMRNVMVPGHICRALIEYDTSIELCLRPSSFNDSQSSETNSISHEICGKAQINPQEIKSRKEKQFQYTYPDIYSHAVCAVQTFRNPQSGPMLYLFVKYYIIMGWRVIVYDRFGYHREFLEELLSEPAFHYHPYTIMQLAQPNKYNEKYAKAQGFDMKYFYKMEKNWGYVAKRQADTADQDQDKTRTYDYCRVEFAHLDVILFIDTDEFFFCPQARRNQAVQRTYQHSLMERFSLLGVEEMRFVRLPYAGFVSSDALIARNYSDADLANHTNVCMQHTYATRDPAGMFACWSTASSYDDFPKSADLAHRCPFHYNHWSCDGMRGGGRDHTSMRCRCKVAFDMMNGFEYRPIPERCHLVHLNDNKYRFQSRRGKRTSDRGEITAHSTVALTLATLDDENTSSAEVVALLTYHDRAVPSSKHHGSKARKHKPSPSR